MRDFLRLLQKLLGLLVLSCGTVVFVVGVAVLLFLPGGLLGPDGVDSLGAETVIEIAREFGIILLISIALWTAGAFLLRGMIP
jgi:hypothetical protein